MNDSRTVCPQDLAPDEVDRRVEAVRAQLNREIKEVKQKLLYTRNAWYDAGYEDALELSRETIRLLEKRLDYLLSRCFVNRFGEIALPTGCMVISREEKEASIALIDRAIEVREKGL